MLFIHRLFIDVKNCLMDTIYIKVSFLAITIQEGELVLVGVFSENYSFVVQDAVQGYHWDNSQCTIHPFVAYYPSSNGVQHQSYCFISNDLKHNATMVYTFINHLIAELKSKHKSLRKIHCFSDGCGA